MVKPGIHITVSDDKYRMCNCCLNNKRMIYDINFHSYYGGHIISLCRKCLKEMLVDGISIYNETKGMKPNGKKKEK